MPDTDMLELLLDVAQKHCQLDSPLDMSTFFHPCGTFGCLAGWAAQDPRFKALGLAVIGGTYRGNRQGSLILRRLKNGEPYTIANFEALRELFKLDDYQACYLFGNNPDNYGVENIIDWHDALVRIAEVIRGEV